MEVLLFVAFTMNGIGKMSLLKRSMENIASLGATVNALILIRPINR